MVLQAGACRAQRADPRYFRARTSTPSASSPPPYDLSELGYQPIAIETSAGKAEYAAAQRGFTERSTALRRRLLDLLADLPG